MESCWALLLILGAVAAAPLQITPLSYEQVVASAVDIYNQEPSLEFTSRLLEAEPQPDWDPSAQTEQALRFTIKETVCHPSEKPIVSQCDYKEDGVTRDCSGFYFAGQSPPIIVMQCEDVDEELERITRNRLQKLLQGAGQFLRKHGPKIIKGVGQVAKVVISLIS